MKNRFNIDLRIFDGYYSADYFQKTREIIKKFKPNQKVTMQWFQRRENTIVCGIEVIKEILRLSNVKDLKVEGLNDGDVVNSNEPVLKITGHYADFGHFEGLFDGILSRCSTIATNVNNVYKAANGKQIINMNDRMDYYTNQQIDGYASIVGKVDNLVTKAAFEFLEQEPNLKGTMPHALIASFGGDLLKAAHAYKKQFPKNKLVVLVDYNNDCINDALKVCYEFKQEVYAVRIDTSPNLVDKSLQNLVEENNQYHGVNPTLVKKIREKLDENNFNHVKIIVSSGFTEEKIKYFEKEKTPVDIYGVGDYITSNKISFTGDIVNVDGQDQAKFGRNNTFSNRIKSIKYI